MKGGREEIERKLQVVVTNDKIKTEQYKRVMMGYVFGSFELGGQGYLFRGGDIQVEIPTMMRKSQP